MSSRTMDRKPRRVRVLRPVTIVDLGRRKRLAQGDTVEIQDRDVATTLLRNRIVSLVPEEPDDLDAIAAESDVDGPELEPATYREMADGDILAKWKQLGISESAIQKLCEADLDPDTVSADELTSVLASRAQARNVGEAIKAYRKNKA